MMKDGAQRQSQPCMYIPKGSIKRGESQALFVDAQ